MQDTDSKKQIMLDKPQVIEDDEYKSAKWDELTEGHNFSKSDIPMLTLLCQWYAVLDRCITDISVTAKGGVVTQNKLGEWVALPQISIMRCASAEIRQLSKQLGFADNDTGEEASTNGNGNVLDFLVGKREQERRAAATN